MRVYPLVLLALIAACNSSGLFQNGGLDGTWDWQFNNNPSGSGITLSLVTAGPNVTGTGGICGVGPRCSPGAVTITGRGAGNAFHLIIRGDSSFVATYSGQLVGQNELSGAWIHAADSNTVIFYRR